MRQIQILRSFTAIFWLGFFMAISFMEAPLKFTAPGVSMEEGVMIGRVVFSALNKCEWAFFLILLATWFFNRPPQLITILISSAGVILALESLWLLPVLDANVSIIVRGHAPQRGNAHLIYVLLEMAKVPVLLLIGWKSALRNPLALK